MPVPRPGLRPSGRLKIWLYRTLHGELERHARRESRRGFVNTRVNGGDDTRDTAADTARCTPENNRFAEVLRQVGRLPRIEQAVLLLRLEHGLTYREISTVVERPADEVSEMLHNAVTKLAGKLAGSKE